MVEGGGLLNRYTVTSRIVGSNPIPSANLLFFMVFLILCLGLMAYQPDQNRRHCDTFCDPVRGSEEVACEDGATGRALSRSL